MKNLLLTTIAAVVVVGCGESQEIKQLSFVNDIGMGNVERVKQAIADGAELNYTKDGKWKSPLHGAVWHNRKEIAELLIAAGADVNFKDGKGRTPLDTVSGNQTEIADLLRKHGGKTAEELAAPNKKLTDAAFNGDIITVKQCLAAGTDVDAKDKHGSTSLHLAAREGHKEIGLVGKEIVELLIANGADVNASSRHGTPLDVAIFNKHPETADLLRKHGAKTGEELK
jgi:ankyrin repeat protein